MREYDTETVKEVPETRILSSFTIEEAADSELMPFDSDIWASKGGFGKEISMGALIYFHWKGWRGFEKGWRLERRWEMYNMESKWSAGDKMGEENLPEGGRENGSVGFGRMGGKIDDGERLSPFEFGY